MSFGTSGWVLMVSTVLRTEVGVSHYRIKIRLYSKNACAWVNNGFTIPYYI